MSLIFKPNGTLDIATDPSDLKQETGTVLTGDSGKITSYTMARCKNLRLDRMGMARTRLGMGAINATAISAIRRIVEHGGTRYSFAGTQIYSNESSIATEKASTDWQAILYNAYNDTTQDIFALNGSDRIRIEGGAVYNWGIAAPDTAPTIATGASTGLTGDYNAKYTYCRKSGSTVICESDPSDAGTAVTLANGSLSITWTASSDSQVTHVRIYRTLTDGGTYYHDQDVAIGTTTLDSTTADASLGGEVATDHDRPPSGSYVAGPNYNGTCFIAFNNLLYYCLPKQPEYWPQTYYIEVSPPQFPIQCVVFYDGQPYCLTKHQIYHIQGTGHESFFPYDMKAVTGAVNANAAVAITGRGIAHVGTDGIYLYSSGLDKNVTQNSFDPIFHGESVGGIPAISSLANCWLFHYRNELWFGYASEGYAYPRNVLVLNLDSNRATYYSYDVEILTMHHDKTNDQLLAGCSDGYIRKMETGNLDDGAAISWEVQSKDYQLQTRAHFPRWIKYDVDASDPSCTATASLLMDGTVHQEHSLTGNNRDVKKRLVKTGNGQKLAFRVSGTGPVTIYAIEGE